MRSALQTKGIINLLVSLWHHLHRRHKLQFGMVLGLMLVSAFAEVVSLSAVLPFLGILISPDRIFNHPLAADVVQVLDITSADQLVLPLTIMFVVAALMSGTIRMFLLWVNTRLVFSSGTDLSIDVYQRTLYQPYSVHIARNSSEVVSGITGKVNNTINTLSSVLILINATVSVVAVVGTLIIIDPTVALIAFTGFGLSYGFITRFVRHRLERNSQLVAHEQTQVIKALQEGLGGIRDVLLDGTQSTYCDIFRQADFSLKRASANNMVISGSPRFAMEALGITLISGLAYGFSSQGGGIAASLPTLGALALGTQRLLPTLQLAYNAWSSIVSNHASVADTIDLLDQPVPTKALQVDIPPLRFQNFILFNNVHFRYRSDGPWVLEGFNLTIPKGSRVGFIGITGCGKSTALDLLMGLLQPTKGEILVDGEPIDEKRARAWQQTIAHVSQTVFLADSTIAENIAFGVPWETIDRERMKEAAQSAQIDEFIEKQVEGYNTFVGERGIRLSGGQRQRIGIARALYKKASVLVFDEATSALDNATEESVMRSIEGLSDDLTILIIAHRLTTTKQCDFVVKLEGGRVETQVNHAQLRKSGQF